MKSTRICPEPRCDRPIRARGVCATHYQALRRTARDGSCGVAECPDSNFTRGYCVKHYQRLMKFGSTELPPKPEPKPKPEPRMCVKPDCEGRAFNRSGLCRLHYQPPIARHRPVGRGGRLRTRAPRDATTDERFWMKVEKTISCWYWLGAISDSGYGNFYLSGGSWIGAHRYSYGRVPDGLVLDHVCHSIDASCTKLGPECLHRRCVNPAHLEAVTTAENLRRARERSIK